MRLAEWRALLALASDGATHCGGKIRAARSEDDCHMQNLVAVDNDHDS